MPRSIALLVLVSSLALGILYEIGWQGHAPGVNAAVLAGFALVAAFAVAYAGGGGRMDPFDSWLAPASLLFAAFTAVRADPWLVPVDLAFAVALAVAAFAALGGARITRGAVPAVWGVVVAAVKTALVGAVRVIGAARPELPRASRPSIPPALLPVARGVALALPVLLVFGLLFAAADAVFAAVAHSVLDVRIALDLDAAARTSIEVGGVAWVTAGLLLLAAVAWVPPVTAKRASTGGDGAIPGWVTPEGGRGGQRQDPAGPAPASGAAVAPVPLTARAPSRATEAATVLVLLDLLFGAFVVLQVAYLFGGRDTLAAAGLTYADYARRGFFELVAVAALAVVLVAGLDAAVGRRSRAQLVASLVLLGLTAVVLASAFERLRLYQAAYGWTELRFVVGASIGWLASALAATAVLLARRRTPWLLHALGILLLVGLAAMNVVGPQAFVAERNLERVLNPGLVAEGGRTGLDHDYLAGLGDEAVPAVVAVLDRLDPVDRQRLEAFLASRETALRTDPALTGWPSWNAARERARAALASWRARATAGTGR